MGFEGLLGGVGGVKKMGKCKKKCKKKEKIGWCELFEKLSKTSVN